MSSSMSGDELLESIKGIIDGKDVPFELPDHLKIDDVSIDVSEIPLFDPSIVDRQRHTFVRSWPILQDLMQQPLSTWLPHLFPKHIVPEDKKWAAYELLKQVVLVNDESNDNGSSDLTKICPSEEQDAAAIAVEQRLIVLTNLELILRRAIVCLQCNLPLHAYSDVKLVETLVKEFITREQKKNQDNNSVGLANSVCFSLSQIEMNTIQILAMIMMNDCRAIMINIIPYFLARICMSDGKFLTPLSASNSELLRVMLGDSEIGRQLLELCYSDEIDPHLEKQVGQEESRSSSVTEDANSPRQSMQNQLNVTVANIALRFLGQHLQQSGITMNSAGVITQNRTTKKKTNDDSVMNDVNLQAALFMLDVSQTGNMMIYLNEREKGVTPSIELNPFIVILVRYFYLLHVDVHKRHVAKMEQLQALQSSTSSNSKMTGTLSKSIEDIEYVTNQYSFNTCKLPLEYRGGPGGDRDPNTVLRTLFALRREEMANVRVTVDRDKGGFKLVAKRDIQAGEVFLIEKPFADFDGYPVHRHARSCSHCLNVIAFDDRCSSGQSKMKGTKKHTTITRCPLCQECYCSEGCRQEACDRYHKVLCVGTVTGKGWSAFIDSLELNKTQSAMSSNLCLALKLAITAECQGLNSALNLPEIKILHRVTDKNEPIVCSDSDPTAPPPMVDWPRGEKIRDLFQLFHHYCPTLLLNLTVVDLTILHAVLAMNVMGGREENESTGEERFHTCIHLVASFANHDCVPNTIYFTKSPFEGDPRMSFVDEMYGCSSNPNAIKFVALRGIKMNEEIAISYVDTNEDYHYRAAQLFATYNMTCHCMRCQKEQNDVGIVVNDNKTKGIVSSGKKK